MKKYMMWFLAVLCMTVASSCKHDEDEVYPIRFGVNDVTIMMGVRNVISFVDGGGVYKVAVSDSTVLGVPTVNARDKAIFITPLSTGSATLTVTDVRAKADVTLNVTVENFRMVYKINDIKGENTNTYVSNQDELWFVKSDGNGRTLKVVRDGSPVAVGKFDITMGETEATMTMELNGVGADAGQEAEVHVYKMNATTNMFDIFNVYFEFKWEKLPLYQSVQPIESSMELTDTGNGCVIYGNFRM